MHASRLAAPSLLALYTVLMLRLQAPLLLATLTLLAVLLYAYRPAWGRAPTMILASILMLIAPGCREPGLIPAAAATLLLPAILLLNMPERLIHGIGATLAVLAALSAVTALMLGLDILHPPHIAIYEALDPATRGLINIPLSASIIYAASKAALRLRKDKRGKG